MGYGDESRQTLTVHEKTADVWSGGAGDDLVLDITMAMTILRIGATVTTATVSTGNIEVNADRRITTGSDTGRVDKLDGTNGKLLIPTATAAGKVVYKDVHVDVVPGDQVVFELITAAAGGGAAGAGRYFVEAVARHEVAGNLTDMVASA